MDFLTGKPDHIEDYLIRVRSGAWFGFSDPSNKIYANLIKIFCKQILWKYYKYSSFVSSKLQGR